MEIAEAVEAERRRVKEGGVGLEVAMHGCGLSSIRGGTY